MFGVKIVVLTKFSPGLYLGFFVALGEGGGISGSLSNSSRVIYNIVVCCWAVSGLFQKTQY